MMKTFLLMCLCLTSTVFAQTTRSQVQERAEEQQAKQEEQSIDKEREKIEKEEMQEEEVPEEQAASKSSSDGQNVFQIECQCPEPVQEQQATGFPPNAVFFMAPQPAPVPQEEVAPRDESVPPNYGGKLPTGYDDSTYRQIGY